MILGIIIGILVTLLAGASFVGWWLTPGRKNKYWLF